MNHNAIKRILVRLAICFSLTLILSCSILSVEYLESNSHNSQVEIANKDNISVKGRLNYININTRERIYFPYMDITSTLSLDYNGSYGFYAGCNSFSGKYIANEEKISFKSAIGTSKNCYNIKVERIVNSSLMVIDNYDIYGKQLFLKKGNEILMVYDIIYE